MNVHANPERPDVWWRGLLLVHEFGGAAAIFWHGVPIYRELLAGNFNQAEPAVRVMGDCRDCVYSNRILASLPAPGIAIPTAPCLYRSCLDVPGPLEPHFHGRRF